MEHQNKCRATGKVRFPDPGAAKEAILRIKSTNRFYDHIQGKRINRRAGKPDQCRFYYCRECHGWHLTSSEQGVSARKFRKERRIETKDFLLDSEQAAEWKKDSLPFPETKKEDMTIEFVNAQEMAVKYPKTFEAPTEQDLQDIEISDYVKICPGNERFWCCVVSIDKDKRTIVGAVSNSLLEYDWLPGDELEFNFDNVYQILKPHDIA